MFFRQRPCHCTKHSLGGPSQCSQAICRWVPFSVTQSLLFVTSDGREQDHARRLLSKLLHVLALTCLGCPFPLGVFHTSFQKKFKYHLFNPEQSLLYTLCPRHIVLYQNLYISKSCTRLYTRKRPKPRVFVFPQYLCIRHRSVNECLRIKLSSQCPEYTLHHVVY